MLRSRFLWRLYAGYAALILLTALVVGWLIAVRVQREALAETDQRLTTDARLLREVASNLLTQNGGHAAALQERVLALGEEIGTRLTVINAEGRVLADSREADPSRLDNHAGRPEVIAAREQGRGAATRFSRTLGQRMRYLAIPLDVEGEGRAFARTALPLSFIQERLSQLRRRVLLGAAIATLPALLLAFLIARSITFPLRSMTAAAESLTRGDYDREVSGPGRGDELGKLARAFDTMRIRLREQLESSTLEQSKLTAILGSMAEGMVAVDRDERIVHMNQVAGALLGISPEAAQGRHIWEITRIREVSEVLRETVEQQAPAQRAVRLPGRGDRILELRAMPLRQSSGGEPQGAVLVFEDVTQLRKLETVRQDFVGNVSHELKTPVTAIRGLVETVLEDDAMPPSVRKDFLSKVRSQTLRLSTLVTDILSLSRLETDPGDLLNEPLDIRAAAHEAVRALQPRWEAQQVRMDLHLPEEPAIVLAEPEALQEALVNLLDNAIKYSGRGESVEVTIENAGEHIEIRVRDHGPGIEKHHLERIFERFYRVDKARSRALGGTGLGLAIVKHIALGLGGEVSVESEPGEGSTFRLRVPRHTQ